MNPELDALTRKLTAFESFMALLDTHRSYRPTILPRDRDHVDLADAYDASQGARGDARRAWRGTGAQVLGTDRSPEGYLSVTLGGVPAGSGLYSEWLRVIHEINRAAAPKQPIGEPDSSHDRHDGSWVEEYPEYRVILRYTKWGHAANTGTIQAKTRAANDALRAAVSKEVPA